MTRAWLRIGSVIALALSGESAWGAVKFHGGWHIAYGCAAFVALVVSALLAIASHSQGQEPS